MYTKLFVAFGVFTIIAGGLTSPEPSQFDILLDAPVASKINPVPIHHDITILMPENLQDDTSAQRQFLIVRKNLCEFFSETYNRTNKIQR